MYVKTRRRLHKSSVSFQSVPYDGGFCLW